MTTETNTTPAPGTVSPGRAACEAFWAGVGAGPSPQDPAAAWHWALSQKTTRAWEAAAKAAVAAAGRDPAEARADAAEALVTEALQTITTFLTLRVCGTDTLELAEGLRQILTRQPAPPAPDSHHAEGQRP